MNITHISAVYPPSTGGLENVVYNLTSKLANKKQFITIITSTIRATTTRIQSSDNFTVKYLPSFEIAHTPIIPLLFFSLLKQKTDIFHVHIAQAYAPEIATLVSIIKKIPLISHYHIDVQTSGRFGILLKPYHSILLRRVLKKSHRVICLTNKDKLLLQRKYKINGNKITVIPNGIPAKYFFNRTHTSSHVHKILFVGRLVPQKNPELVIKTLCLLNTSFQLTIVGDGELKQKLEALISVHALSHVTLLGYKNSEEIIKLYRKSDLLLMPSQNEGMPLVALEAMASGLPILTSDIPEMRETCGNAAYYIKEYDPKLYAKKIRSLFSNPTDLWRKSMLAYKRASLFTLEKQVEKITRVYNELLPT